MADQAALDALVVEWATLQARIADDLARINAIKAGLATLDPGRHQIAGLTVTVRPPNRSFNLERAVSMLPADLRPACQKTTYDAKLVKGYLAPVVLEACMDPGTGGRVVTLA